MATTIVAMSAPRIVYLDGSLIQSARPPAPLISVGSQNGTDAPYQPGRNVKKTTPRFFRSAGHPHHALVKGGSWLRQSNQGNWSTEWSFGMLSPPEIPICPRQVSRANKRKVAKGWPSMAPSRPVA
jgi:hypothetical protein